METGYTDGHDSGCNGLAVSCDRFSVLLVDEKELSLELLDAFEPPLP